MADRRVRTGTTAWGAGVVCAAIGALMLTEERQIYGLMQPVLPWIGALLCASGAFLLFTMTRRRRSPAAIGAHLLVGSELVGIALTQAPLRFLAAAVSLALLGLAALVAAFLPVRRQDVESREPIDLFVLVAAGAIAACGGTLLFSPDTIARTAELDLVGLKPWYASALILVGLALLTCELSGALGRLPRAVVAVLVGAGFWSFVWFVALPTRSAVGTVIWAGTGLLVPVLPWFGPRLRRLTRASIRTRIAFLLAGITAVGVLSSIVVDSRIDDTALTGAVLEQQRMVATSIAALLGADNAASLTRTAAAQSIEAERNSLGGTAEEIYLVDATGEGLAPVDTLLAPVMVEALQHAGAPGTLVYSADGTEHMAGFAPVNGLGWWVVVDRTNSESMTSIVESADYLIVLLAISLAALVGAVAAGRLAGPLTVMSAAAEKLADGDTSEPLPTSDITEVAHLAAAFARLRDRLAIRTEERERAEAALQEVNRDLTALVSASPVGVIGLGPDGMIAEWNPAAERLLGWKRSDVVGRDVSAVLESQPGRPSHLGPHLAGSTFNGVEMRLLTRDQESVPFAVWSAALRGQDDSLDGSLIIVADISARRRLEAERARRMREESHRAETEAVLDRFTFLADASGDLSSSLDLETTLQRAASVAVPQLADWCTVHLVAASGKIETVARAIADPDLESTLDDLQQHYPPAAGGLSPGAQALQSGEPVLISEVSHEWLASTAQDDRQLDLLERLAPRSVMGVPLIARNRMLGAMTFASVTPERQYDAASLALATALARRCALAIDNAQLYRETQDALRARETFLSIASHELGAPLARLKLYTEVLTLARSRNAVDDTLLTRSLSSIERAINRLTAITQDLLDMARWAGGELAIRPTRMDLGKVVRECVASYQQRFTGEHRLTVRIARGKHMVSGDVNRLEQVCENLLDNAFKYSPDGGNVQVAVRSVRGGVLLQVIDTGIGLPPAAADGIFEPFGRAPNAERRSISGMGLGLFICRRIVERHGGRIWAESPGELQGTTMNVWLPGAHM